MFGKKHKPEVSPANIVGRLEVEVDPAAVEIEVVSLLKEIRDDARAFYQKVYDAGVLGR